MVQAEEEPPVEGRGRRDLEVGIAGGDLGVVGGAAGDRFGWVGGF